MEVQFDQDGDTTNLKAIVAEEARKVGMSVEAYLKAVATCGDAFWDCLCLRPKGHDGDHYDRCHESGWTQEESDRYNRRVGVIPA
jgi:hypothetical protein